MSTRTALAKAYSDGYNAATTMARCYGHTDNWPAEEEPRNPYDEPADEATGTPSETLRAAAVRLRQVADTATPGPWRPVAGTCCGSTIEYAYVKAGDWLVADCGATDGEDKAAGDARYIATMHPGVAVALARWLDWEADGEAFTGVDGATRVPHPTQPEALAVARAVLGEA